jgi:hypothetical protein
MHGDEIAVVLVMLSLMTLVFGIFYIRNRENMALIERGINPRNGGTVFPRPPRPFGSLKYGLLMLGAGLGLFAAFMVDINIPHKAIQHGNGVYYEDYPQIYFALIAVGGGLGLVISYLIEKKSYDKLHDNSEPPL